MNLLSVLNEHLALISGILASLAALIPQVRRAIVRLWGWWFRGRRMQAEILEKVTSIEKEMQFNGGSSLRDMVVIQVNRQRAQFWRSARPSVEMDRDAQVHLVSETACHLLGVADPHHLYLRNWLNCVAGRVDEFLEAYANAVKFNSCISFRLAMLTYDGEERGTWEIRLSPVTPPGSHRPLYSGYLKPVCDKAKAAAEMLG